MKFRMVKAVARPPARNPSRGSLRSVRTLLSRLVLACLLPGILGATGLFIYEYRQSRTQLERNTIQTARALAQAVDTQILRALALAQGLATADSLANDNFATFHHQARWTLKQAELGSTVAISREDAQQVVNTAREVDEILPRNGNPDLVTRVFETRKPVISDIFISSVRGHPLMAVGVPVFRGGAITYALTVTVLPAAFDSLLSAQGLPSGWVATIFDSKGTIVARSREGQRFVGQKPADEYFNHLMEVNEGTFEAVMRDGVSVLAAHTRSPATGWQVAISIPQEALRARFAPSLWALILGIITLFTIGLLVASLMAGKLARSFQALVAPASALGAGNVFTAPTVEVQEAAEVTKALGEAANLLEKRSTALVNANQVLRNSERRLALALQAGGTAVWEMDVPSRTLFPADDLLFTMLGYTPREMLTAEQWLAKVHGDDRSRVSSAIEDVIQGKQDSSLAELRVAGKDGRWHWIFCQAVAAERDAEGRPLRLVGTHTDITDRKEAEAEIQRLNTELEKRVQERTAQLEHSNEALMRSNIELQRFAHAAAHDLQTPLRSIVGFTQLIQQELKGQITEQAGEWLDLVIANTKRLQILIQELLAYARLDAQARPFEPINLQAVVDEVINNLQSPIHEVGAEISCDALPTVMADRTQIIQLFQNLIENGIKYNRSRPPRVAITCEHRGNEWVFAVADNGIGIDPRHHDRIFEIFRRLHSQQEIPGTGIGLAICCRVIERHGGRIWVESQAGKGSVFYFSLPFEDLELPTAS